MSEQQGDTGADRTGGGTADTADGVETEAARGSDTTGEVSSPPREHRREVDPGSVATEFGDRADEAPDDPVAHPSI